MQSEASISPTLMRTILDSIGCTIAMRCGGNYARLLARQFGGAVKYTDLVNLPNFQAWIKTPKKVFAFQTLPLPEEVEIPYAIPLPPSKIEVEPVHDEVETAVETENPISFDLSVEVDGVRYGLRSPL